MDRRPVGRGAVRIAVPALVQRGPLRLGGARRERRDPGADRRRGGWRVRSHRQPAGARRPGSARVDRDRARGSGRDPRPGASRLAGGCSRVGPLGGAGFGCGRHRGRLARHPRRAHGRRAAPARDRAAAGAAAVTFARLRTGDWVAMIAALALLLIMAADWYSTRLGDEARDVQKNTQGNLRGEAGQDIRDANQDARTIAEGEERNAWQADALIDRVILLTLLATVALALAAGFLRAAGRSFEPPLTPSALAAVAAGAA